MGRNKRVMKLVYPDEIIEAIKVDPEIHSYYDSDFVVCFDKMRQELLDEKILELQTGYINMASFNLDYCEVGFCCDNCALDRYEEFICGEGDASFHR